MKRSAWIITAIIALLVAGVFFAGCSDESGKTGDTTSQAAVTAAATTSGALYSEGDIVKNPKSTLTTGLLIVGYDSGTDMYERATIYPFSDGSWGYRMDTKTTKASRATLEKVYTEKVGTVTVSSVQIGAPTTVATTVTTETTTAPVTSETTVSTTAPRIIDIDPFIGTAGTTVKITDLKGSNFVSGATVSLTKSGETSIAATDVSVDSATKITCKFALPISTESGQWNVVITNPDKQVYTSANLFTVYKNTSATATATSTSTTTTTSAAAVTITQIQDPILVTGGGADYRSISILGTNLGYATSMKLTGPSTITSSTYIVSTSTYATGYFNIPAGVTGTGFYVSVLDASGNVLATSSGTVEIR